MTTFADKELIERLDAWEAFKNKLEGDIITEQSMRMGIINRFKLDGRSYLSDGRRLTVQQRYRRYKLRPGIKHPDIPEHLAGKLLKTNLTLNVAAYKALPENEKESLANYVEETISELGELRVERLKEEQLPALIQQEEDIPGL